MTQHSRKTDLKPGRGMPRSLIYAMIPLGFILLVLVMVVVGNWTEETAPDPGTVEEPTQPADPSRPPSAPAD
ncbi:MAG: hypothetical protein P1U72_06265 [Paracoccaceae bacterium]|nr:hypothetical protein [Paracoccaceae bacterium]